MNIKLKSAAFVGIVTMLLSGLTVPVAAQKTRRAAASKIVSAAPGVTAVLTDSFTDSDGKAKPGDEITYTATIVNNGTSEATNVVYTDTIDAQTTVVAGSVQVQPGDSPLAIRCAFTPGSISSNCFSAGDRGNFVINNRPVVLSRQDEYLSLIASNINHNANSQTFAFDAAVQNLLSNTLGTTDGTTLDPAGIKLFVNGTTVTSGSGSVTVANPDGSATFDGADRPYFQYNQMLAQNEVTGARNLLLNVPNTVSAFTVDFFVYTRVQAKLVINEVMVNPANPITDASGEWFEVYNAGFLPIDMQNFKVNDYGAADTGNGCENFASLCSRPAHMIASSLVVPAGGYVVFGNSTNTVSNGGVPVDYSYGATLALINSLDGVRIQSPDNLTIDKALFASAATSAQDGVSRELKNPALDNTNIDDSNWGSAMVTSVYGPGGRGTPRAQNSFYTPFWAGNETTLEKFGFYSVSGSANKNNSGGESQARQMAGETVSVNVGTISAGGSAVVTYKVVIANPLPTGTTEISTQGTVAGDGFSVPTDDPSAAGADDATVTPIAFAPTAAPVIISGRVTTASGRGIRNVQITMTDASGNTKTTQTTAFGYYRFDNIAAGETVTLSAKARRFSFTRSTIVRTTNESIADADFVSGQ